MLWEGYLEDKDFLVGEEFSLADCAFYPVLAYFIHRGFQLDRLGNLQEYYQRLKKRPSIQMATPVGWDKLGKVNIFSRAQQLYKKMKEAKKS